MTRAILSLCSGIGGLDLGLERAGVGHVACLVERDEWCRGVLGAHWPEAEMHDDVTTFSGAGRSVDLVVGGFPCQPFSLAGKRLAQRDERHLWPHFARIIDEVRPRACVFENVLGLRTAGLRDVLADLAARGFDVEWACLRASDYGAPHLRPRIFIVATHPGRVVVREQPGWLSGACESERAPIPGDDVAPQLDAHSNSGGGGREIWSRELQPERFFEGSLTADADCLRRLEQARSLAEIRGWSRVCGWSLGPAASLDDGLPPGVVRGEVGRARKALGNAVVVRCAEVVGRALVGAAF